MTNNDTKKDLAKYIQSKPEQLNLFELLDPKLEEYSNSIELYDTMPKYYLGGVEREKGKNVESLPIFNREFVHRKKSYKIGVAPAAVLDKKTGKTIYYYPSQREELVEDALRKIATRGGAVQFDDKVGVKFSYYEVQQELLKSGHGYSISQIKLAIEIMGKAGIEIVQKDGNEVSYSSNFFTFVGKETKEMAGKERVVVIFHPLVTQSINDGTYRLFNYDKLMMMKMPLARWLHKRISHLFSQAREDNPYPIKLSTIVRDSGMKSYKTLSERRRQVEKAFEELHERKVLARFQATEDKDKNKILDIRYDLYLTDEFVSDAIKANAVTNLRLDNGIVQKEPFDIGLLRKEIEKPIYGLSKTYINGVIANILNKKEFDEIFEALKAAKDYIERKKDVNAAATTKAAIKENWKPSFSKVETIEGKTAENAEEKRAELETKRKQAEEIRISSISDFGKKWQTIRTELKTHYGEEIFEKWLSTLVPFSYINHVLILEAETKFFRDWILNEYLTKNNEMKNLILGVEPDCKKIEIICRLKK